MYIHQFFLQFQNPARVCVPSINKDSKTDDSDEIQILAVNKVVDDQVKLFKTSTQKSKSTVTTNILYPLFYLNLQNSLKNEAIVQIKKEKDNDEFQSLTQEKVQNPMKNMAIKTEKENDEFLFFRILTENELRSDSVEINYIDGEGDSEDSILDLPNLVYLHKGEDSRIEALAKYEFDTFIECLQEKIMELSETADDVKIEWYGYGLQRGKFSHFILNIYIF